MLPGLYSQRVVGWAMSPRSALSVLVEPSNANLPLKNELVQHRQLQNQAEREMVIVDDIDRFYASSVCIRLSESGGVRVAESDASFMCLIFQCHLNVTPTNHLNLLHFSPLRYLLNKLFVPQKSLIKDLMILFVVRRRKCEEK
jgi:hypothetical protein